MLNLAYKHFKAEWNHYKLASENRIQNIYIPNVYFLEKDFEETTVDEELFQGYLEDYLAYDTPEDSFDPEEYDTTHYFESMGPDEIHNLENQMEG